MIDTYEIDTYEAILLFGPPGSGKGKQGKLISRMKGYFHFSSGDMCGKLDPTTGIGKKVKIFRDKGKLVPDDIIIKLFYEAIEKYIQQGLYDPSNDCLVLDGIPRTKGQVSLIKDKVEVNQIIHLDCNEDELIRRIGERVIIEERKDDADPSVIKKRLQIYRTETLSVLKEYDPNLIYEVDGTGKFSDMQKNILHIHKNILEILIPQLYTQRSYF